MMLQTKPITYGKLNGTIYDAVKVDDMLTVTGWSKTEARLVAAIQELKAQNDELKARVGALEAKP